MEGTSLFLTSDFMDVLEALKAETGYLDKIKEAGSNIMMTCPFHGDGHEHKPSCGISKYEVRRSGKTHAPGTVHCFTCGYTARIEEFVSHLFGHKDGGAFGYKWLARNFIAVEISARKPIKLNLERGGVVIKSSNFVGEVELDSYRYIHEYMYKRKLNDKVINYFDVGYDATTQSMTMPVRDLEGRVPFVYRRSVLSKFFNNAADTPRGMYLYGMYEVMQNIDKVNEIWVCESPIDALSGWVHGKPTVATFTTQITDEQIKLLRSIPKRKLVNAYDNDAAGSLAIAKISKKLGGTKLIYDLEIPSYAKDLNDINNEDWEGLKQKIYASSH